MKNLIPDAYKRIVSKFFLIPVVMLTIGCLVSACSKEEDITNSKTETQKETTSNAYANSLKNTTYYIQQEINLSSFVSTSNGYKISKVEILDNGVKTAISDPTSHVFDKWGEYTLIYTASKDGGKDEEVTIQGFKVNPLVFTFQIEDADNVVHDYSLSTTAEPSFYTDDIEFAASGGLFDLESLILEAIANGTTTQKASVVKSNLARNRILLMGECPNPNMDEYSLFEKVPGKFDDEEGVNKHAWHDAKLFLMGTKEVVSKLDTKALYYYDAVSCLYGNIISYMQSHSDLIFHSSCSLLLSFKFESGTYEDLLEILSAPQNIGVYDDMKKFVSLNNNYFICNCMGNISQSYPLNNTLTLEDVKNGWHGWFSNAMEYGMDVIMGSEKYETRAVANGKGLEGPLATVYPLYPTKENLNNEHVWMEHTYDNPQNSTTATSYAAPAACGKAYLMTCAQLLVNPKLTKAQAHKFVRETAFDGTLNSTETDENGIVTTLGFYGNAKVMNPAGAFYLFHSTLPTSIDAASTELIPITHGLHKNSVVAGPGVVDKDGNAVTESNYTEMLGKDLYIDPTKLYDYGYTAGSTCDYVEYLCVDGKGSGAMDRESEAYKAITSKTFTVTIQ